MIPDSIRNHKAVNILQDFSIALISGVFVTLIFVNINCDLYHSIRTPQSGIGSAFQGDSGETAEATNDEGSGMRLPTV